MRWAAESQLITLLKRLQGGVPVSCEYGTIFVFHEPFLPEPRDLELRVRTGLLDDVTENCEFLGCGHIHLHMVLYEGEFVAYVIETRKKNMWSLCFLSA